MREQRGNDCTVGPEFGLYQVWPQEEQSFTLLSKTQTIAGGLNFWQGHLIVIITGSLLGCRVSHASWFSPQLAWAHNNDKLAHNGREARQSSTCFNTAQRKSREDLKKRLTASGDGEDLGNQPA